ncbi:hypothetical protein BGZ51_000716 [Haplosporangium sp. Z 767]|nr:hypothetical protein BGZ51_000716 [Haplosporangium sp. Z 767]
MASAIPIVPPPGTTAASTVGANGESSNSTSTTNAWTSKSNTSKPSGSMNTPSKPVSLTNSNKSRTCRNIVIHGFCKYEGKGCEFNHDVGKPAVSVSSPEM